MRWIVRLGLAALVLVGGVLLVGSRLPEEHEATMERMVPGSNDEVWNVITTVERFPEWRPGVDRVERLEDRNGLPAWREHGSGGSLTLGVVWLERPDRLVVRVADDGGAFGGSWTYDLSPADDGGTRVTITEQGSVHSPFFRFVSRYVLGHERTLRTYLDALEAHMHAQVE
jgi:uncharacterized protein YndB with AHSA1/START domain